MKEALKEIIRSIYKPFKGISAFMALLAITVISSLLIVTPLWYFSTYYKRAYTLFALLALTVAIVLLLALRIRKIVVEIQHNSEQVFNGTTKIITLLFSLAALALFLMFFLQREFSFAWLIFTLYFIGLGLVKYARKKAKKRHNHS
jgi:hypothetical protein